MEKIREKAWSKPLGRGLAIGAKIAEGLEILSVPAAGLLKGALAFGATLLNPEPSISDLQIEFMKTKEVNKLVSEDISRIRDVVQQTFLLVADGRYKDLEKIDSAYDVFVKKSSTAQFGDMKYYMFELETLATQNLASKRIQAYLEIIHQQGGGLPMSQAVMEYVILVHIKFLQLMVAYHIFIEYPERVTAQFELFNAQYVELIDVFKSVTGDNFKPATKYYKHRTLLSKAIEEHVTKDSPIMKSKPPPRSGQSKPPPGSKQEQNAEAISKRELTDSCKSMMEVEVNKELMKKLSDKFETVTVSRQELEIAEAAMKGQLMDSWVEKMVCDVTRGIPKEDLADYADHVVDSLGIVDSPDDENHTPATDLSKLMKGMRFSKKSKESTILEMNFEDDKCKSMYGFFSMIMEEDETIAVAYAFHKLNFKMAKEVTEIKGFKVTERPRKFLWWDLGPKVTEKPRKFLWWDLEPEIIITPTTEYKSEMVKFGKKDINAIKNTFARHEALVTLQQEGILSKIKYVD